jgi:hypothetical protein
MANIDNEVSIEPTDHGTGIWGFSFAYAATRKTAANASLPTIKTARPSFGPVLEDFKMDSAAALTLLL